MSWRRFELLLVLGNLIVVVACGLLWLAAWRFNFIGNTQFIGHVSMLALVLASLSSAGAALAAWRADQD